MSYQDVKDAAVRGVVSKGLDLVLHSVRGKDRDKSYSNMINLVEKLMGDTFPAFVFEDFRTHILNPDDKWRQFLDSTIDETDPHVLKMHLLNAGYQAGFHGYTKTGEYGKTHDCRLPWIILVDPTSACNKHCIGCWSAEYGNKLNLTFEELDDLITQGEKLGIFFYMMTGGEPLMRQKDIIKLCEKHPKSMFYAFTNGTLITEKLCEDMQRVGNFALCLSVEGFEEENDARRGEGSFEQAVSKMQMLRDHGLIFGTSICYTSKNYETVTSDEFLDFLIDKGVKYSWYFHYMPVGNDANPDLMCTPEQREYMVNRIREVRDWNGGKPIFLMDFQNDAEFVGGCIAGGKYYAHINPNGDVEPCVFIHYSNANIRDMSLEDALTQPLFKAYQKAQPFNQNSFMPCPMLENPEKLGKLVAATGAVSTDLESPESTEHLAEKTRPYAACWGQCADRLAAANPHAIREPAGELPDGTH